MVQAIKSKKISQSLAAQSDMLRLIEQKRAGLSNSSEDIYWMVNHLDSIPDYQLSAWLMAVCINGFSIEETIELTRAMAYSGHVLTLKRDPTHDESHDHGDDDCASIHVPGSRGFVDKHSTGGVGDKVTLALSPILAALGFKISKFSGRSLGHTGGTIDKLESIPGFNVDLSMKQFEKQIQDVGVAIAAQTMDFAPADKRLYSLRDRSATVNSIPLIASSVMSKKLASGADTILLDVKVGSGAFMKELKYAKQLAKQMVAIGKAVNLNTQAFITNMDQPLGYAVGTALEVEEVMKVLSGELKNDFYELVVELASAVASSIEVEDAIRSGKAYVKFEEWISAQGGDLKKFSKVCQAKHELDCQASCDSYIKDLDALTIGQVILDLSHKAKDDSYVVDHSVGLKLHAKIGDAVKPGDLLFKIQGNDLEELEQARARILSAYNFSESKQRKPKLIHKKY